MAKLILKNGLVLIDGYNFSSDHNEISLNYEAEAKEITNYASNGVKEFMAGLTSWNLDESGLWNDADDGVDEQIFTEVGLAGQIVTVGAVSGAGNIVFAGQSNRLSYAPGGKIGDALPFKAKAQGTGVLGRMTMLGQGAKGATGTGTAYNLGAILSTQFLYAVLHVVGPVAGVAPTLDVTIESDDAEGFVSPTTRATFSQKTAIGAQWITPIAGPITDTWWRAKWTIGGAGPSFPIFVAIAIQ